MPSNKPIPRSALLGGIMSMSIAFLPLHAMAADMKSKGEPPSQEQRAVDAADPARVDAQVKELHDKLKITAAQESLWKEVGEAMRDTAKEVRSKLTEHTGKMNGVEPSAVEELRSYKDLQQVQYDGAKRLLDPFEKLYAAMPSDQKKNADEVFEHPREEAAATSVSPQRPSRDKDKPKM
jgi:protein CpxP